MAGRFLLFVDESGEVSNKHPDPHFNVFNLCGILLKDTDYSLLDEKMKALKMQFWGNTDIIFRSYEMRWKLNAFKIFQDKAIYLSFMSEMEKILSQTNYEILSCVVLKDKIIGGPGFDYKTGLEFICERAAFIVNRWPGDSLHICIEKRERSQNRLVYKHYLTILEKGTLWNISYVFRKLDRELHFRSKDKNINGLQLADLCAYPIGYKCLHPDRGQKTYDVIECKIHRFAGKMIGCGLKIIPPPENA